MDVAVRVAGGADWPDVERLAMALRNDLEHERGGVLWRDKDALALDALHRAVADEPRSDTHTLLALIDGHTFGFAHVCAVSLADGSLVGDIVELYVEAGAREIGLGEALLDAAIEWCRAHSCVGIDATALPGMRDTKNFFEGNGFTARKLTMFKRLS